MISKSNLLRARLLSTLAPSELARQKASNPKAPRNNTGHTIKQLQLAIDKNEKTAVIGLKSIDLNVQNRDKMVRIYEYLSRITKSPTINAEFLKYLSRHFITWDSNIDLYLRQILDRKYAGLIVDLMPWMQHKTQVSSAIDYCVQLAMKESRPLTAQAIFFEAVNINRDWNSGEDWDTSNKLPSHWLKSIIPYPIQKPPSKKEPTTRKISFAHPIKLLVDHVTLRQLITSCYKKRDFNDMAKLFDYCWYKNHDYELAMCLQYIVMDVKARFGLAKAISILQNIPRNRLQGHLKSTVVCELVRIGHVQEADLICAGEEEYSFGVYSTWIRHYTKKSTMNLSKALDWYRKLLNARITPNSIIITQILTAIQQQKEITPNHLDLALEMFSSIKSHCLEYDEGVYLAILGILTRANDPKKVDQMVSTIKQSGTTMSLRFQHQLLVYYTRKRDHSKILQVLQRIEQCEPNLQGLLTTPLVENLQQQNTALNNVVDPLGMQYIANTMLTYYLKSQDLDAVLYYLKLLDFLNIEMNEHIKRTVLKHLGKNGGNLGVDSIVQVLFKDSKSIPSLFINSITNSTTFTQRLDILVSCLFYYKNSRDLLAALHISLYLINIIKTQTIDKSTANVIISGFLKTIHQLIIETNSSTQIDHWTFRIEKELEYFGRNGIVLDTCNLYIFRDCILKTKNYTLFLKILNLQLDLITNKIEFDQHKFTNFIRSTINTLILENRMDIVDDVVKVLGIKRKGGKYGFRIVAINSLVKQKLQKLAT